MRKKAFKVVNVRNISDFKEGDFISESDLALQDGDRVVQFKYIPSKRSHKKVIKPGIWQLTSSNTGIALSEIDFSSKRILKDLVNTSVIYKELETFFSKLDVYKELEIQPKRGCLLYSSPGQGKTSTISLFCQQAVEEDPGTVVIVWPTSKIRADDVQEFFASDTKYSSSATRLVLIIEDIGGGNTDSDGPRAVDSGLLNMLDGVGEVFKLPTFIVATTNTPEQLLTSLSDRPGRFDSFIELKPPSADERIKLFEFVSKRPSTIEEAEALKSTKADGLSVAHITEIVVRHRLNDLSIQDVIEMMIKHSAKVKARFEKQSKMGFIDDDEYDDDE